MADNGDVYSSQVFSFLVGEKTFYAHKALISKHSKPLDRLMNADMKEKEQMTATLADVDPATFARFLEWAYKGYYTPAPHTMDELPPALSEVNGIKKEQQDFAGMFSAEHFFTSRPDEGDRLTPRAASLLQPAAPTQGNPPAPFRFPLAQLAAAAPLAPTAAVPAAGIFGAAAAPPSNTTTAAGAAAPPATTNSAQTTAPTSSSSSATAAPPASTSSSTPNPAGNTRSPFSFATSAAPTSATSTTSTTPNPASNTRSPFSLFATSPAPTSATSTPSTTSTSSSTTSTASTFQNTSPSVSRPAPASGSAAATGTNLFTLPSTWPASASSISNPNPNIVGAGGFGSGAALLSSRPAPSPFGSTTTLARAPNASTGGLFSAPSSGGAFGSTTATASGTSNTSTGLFGSNPAPSSNTNSSGLFAPLNFTNSSNVFANYAPSSNTNSSGLFAPTGFFAPLSNPNSSSSIFANPAPSSNTNPPSIFASRATPAFGGFGAPPTAPAVLTQPTGLFGRSPSSSGATTNRQRSPSPFGGKESTPVFGNTSSTQGPPFVSAKDQLKEAFISRKPKVLSTVIEIPPPRGNWQRENHTDVLLSHAQLYVFAEKQDIQSLKILALESLHAALSLFFLYPERTKDIINLLRYSYDNTADYEGHKDELRELLTQYLGLEMEILVKDKGLRDLMTKDDDGIGQEERAALLEDFMGVVAKRL